ncbi:MAG: DEAD/DEAH box helicase [Pseudomonadota bacterium]
MVDTPKMGRIFRRVTCATFPNIARVLTLDTLRRWWVFARSQGVYEFESLILTQFSDLGLADPILRALTAEGYTTPTPIQSQAIPVLCDGKDVLGIAQTGTGKTAAFVLPLLDQLSLETAPPRPKTCRTLILAPTRELAGQIIESISTYGRFLKLRTALVMGGVKPGPQIKAMSRGVDILVATPGRLEDHVAAGRIHLGHTHSAVLDEADQMLDLGFLPAIRRILSKMPRDRQTVMLSATMPGPLRSLAHDFQNSPLEISVAPQAQPVELVEQSAVQVAMGEKSGFLIDQLKNAAVTRSVVFARTKRGADRLCTKLEKAGLTAVAIHGNKSQVQRSRALNSFRSGRASTLVATDIAARGIDIDDVSHVFNFDVPMTPEAYVHRIGRTARAGRSGTAITLCDPEEFGLLRDIERITGITLLEGGIPAPNQRRSKKPVRRKPRRPGARGQSASRNAAGGRGQSKKPDHVRQSNNPNKKGGRQNQKSKPRAAQA